MSAGGTATRTVRPPWLPPEKTLDAVAAGRWWDAIAVDGDLGARTAEHLTASRGRTGPIVCDPLGPVPRWYFLVPAGTAARWNEPDTEALGECCYIGIPGSLDADQVGVHWVSRPDMTAEHVRPRLLRQVLAEVRGGAPWPETEPTG